MKEHSILSKALAKSNLRKKSLLIPSLKVETMDDFLSNNDVGSNMSTLGKSSL